MLFPSVSATNNFQHWILRRFCSFRKPLSISHADNLQQRQISSKQNIARFRPTVSCIGILVVMPIQDDARENQMIDRFNLTVPADRSRSDIDAHLQISGLDIPFELKSTTTGSIATARDFGMSHINKWRNDKIHWLFGFYLTDERHADYFIYCSPDAMEPWYFQMQQYIRPDILLGERLPENVSKKMVIELLGHKTVYSIEDAQSVMKKQWTVKQYQEKQDVKDTQGVKVGYSMLRMVEILQERARYVIARGSTLNNPHIPQSYFFGMQHITDDPSIVLRNMVRTYLKNTSAIEDAAA